MERWPPAPGRAARNESSVVRAAAPEVFREMALREKGLMGFPRALTLALRETPTPLTHPHPYPHPHPSPELDTLHPYPRRVNTGKRVPPLPFCCPVLQASPHFRLSVSDPSRFRLATTYKETLSGESRLSTTRSSTPRAAWEPSVGGPRHLITGTPPIWAPTWIGHLLILP